MNIIMWVFRLKWFVTGNVVLLKQAKFGTLAMCSVLQFFPLVTLRVWGHYPDQLTKLLTPPLPPPHPILSGYLTLHCNTDCHFHYCLFTSYILFILIVLNRIPLAHIQFASC